MAAATTVIVVVLRINTVTIAVGLIVRTAALAPAAFRAWIARMATRSAVLRIRREVNAIPVASDRAIDAADPVATVTEETA